MMTDTTAVALRVLTAIHDGDKPNYSDVVLLRAYLPERRHCDPDEPACVAIQEALNRRKETRDGRRSVRE